MEKRRQEKKKKQFSRHFRKYTRCIGMKRALTDWKRFLMGLCFGWTGRDAKEKKDYIPSWIRLIPFFLYYNLFVDVYIYMETFSFVLVSGTVGYIHS